MSDFLLELFSEEIPARMQTQAADDLSSRLQKALQEARLSHGQVRTYVTPRRLAVQVEGLPAVQPDREVEKKGPKVGAPQGAIDGFCRSVGLDVAQLEQRSIGKDVFYFAVTQEKGKPTSAALKEMVEAIIASFPWPKSQRWGAYPLTWVRPLRAMVCLFDDQIIPVSFGHITASNVTYGHRFLAPDAIIISTPAAYEAELEKAHVIADSAKRKAVIRKQALAAASAKGVELRLDEGLLEEVTGLVEWPVCLMGQFDEKYLSLPPEVLILEMKHHQKYFACYGHERSAGSEQMPTQKEQISRHFLLISNMVTQDGGAAIVHGNQRVLRARLDDGRFYWEHDRDTPLANWKPSLEKMIFHAKLGSVADKAERIAALSPLLAVFVPHANLTKVARAGTLCKSDLVSGMVGQFPELQGVMGRYYALAQKEDAEVADAIRDHYKPAGAEDAVPTQPVSVVVALADKFDSLVGLFAIGEKPTGSKDPFALRRAALGVIRIIFENQLRLPLRIALENAIKHYPKALFKEQGKDAQVEELLAFFSERLKVLLKADGVRHDLIEAVFDGGREDDLVRLVARVRALEGFLGSADGANLLTAYTRASNIVTKEEKKDGVRYSGKVEDDLLAEPAEKALYGALEQLTDTVEAALKKEDFAGAMTAVAALRAPVDSFFEQVMVNAEDAALRRNRLHLLSYIRSSLDALANFAKIEAKS